MHWEKIPLQTPIFITKKNSCSHYLLSLRPLRDQVQVPGLAIFISRLRGSVSTYKKNIEDGTDHCTKSYYSCSSVFLFFFFIDEISSSKSSVPFSFRVNLASEYGWYGESIIFAVLFSPDFLRYIL